MKITESGATTQAFNQQPYSTKRDGLNISNCDSEPVHTPGCVQAHGALLVLRSADLRILQASDNVQSVLGHAVESLLDCPVEAVIGLDGESRLRALLAEQPTDRNPLYLLTLPARQNEAGMANMLDVTVHTIDGVVILEFESTGRTSAASPDYYGLVKKTVARLQTAGGLVEFCTMAAEEIRDLTGMDRVMVYKFHEDGHGEVFAESKRPDLSSWVGMHYPAEDIPKPARDVFCKTWVRPIPDMSDALAELVPLVNPDTGKPLEMTYCFLRGVSKMCTEYYRNIGVAATITMSIRRGDHLWGLLSCTYYAGPKYLPYQVRAACEFLAQVVCSTTPPRTRNIWPTGSSWKVSISSCLQTLHARATWQPWSTAHLRYWTALMPAAPRSTAMRAGTALAKRPTRHS
jgi:chemotaxis family two-component system sensor kinase Cph1